MKLINILECSFLSLGAEELLATSVEKVSDATAMAKKTLEKDIFDAEKSQGKSGGTNEHYKKIPKLKVEDWTKYRDPRKEDWRFKAPGR